MVKHSDKMSNFFFNFEVKETLGNDFDIYVFTDATAQKWIHTSQIYNSEPNLEISKSLDEYATIKQSENNATQKYELVNCQCNIQNSKWLLLHLEDYN